jgi:hypothetical protein
MDDRQRPDYDGPPLRLDLAELFEPEREVAQAEGPARSAEGAPAPLRADGFPAWAAPAADSNVPYGRNGWMGRAAVCLTSRVKGARRASRSDAERP